MKRSTYSMLLRLSLPWVLARTWLRGAREPGYRRHLSERLGFYDRPAAIDRPVIWIHAVSVGEARAAAPLVAALVDRHRNHDILMTCMTAAGRDTIGQVYGNAVRAAYLPCDLPGAARRFVTRFRPTLGVLIETELWPNLLAECAARNVPVVLANARLSEKSRAGYARWSELMRPAFEALTAVCAQSDADAVRLSGLGAGPVEVCGNLKFDAQLDEAKLEEGRSFARALGGRRVVVFASTREGEEEMLLDRIRDVKGDWLAVIVPRHPRRFDAVADLVRSRMGRPPRRSRGDRPGPGDRVLLGDSMGEMAFYYGLADVAVIGGSFLPLGGQNLIEPCAAGVPVVFGPHMFNFADASKMALETGAALQAPDATAAVRLVDSLINDPDRRSRLAEAGRALCEAHRGATARHMQVIEQVLAKATRTV